MNPGIETSLLSKPRAGELDCSELSVLSVDQPTVTGAGVETARSRTLESVITRMSAIRFIVLSRQTSLQYFDVIGAHLDSLRFVGRSLPSWRTSPRSCFPYFEVGGTGWPTGVDCGNRPPWLAPNGRSVKVVQRDAWRSSAECSFASHMSAEMPLKS
jgi:hypothetical protein